jgi:hypothetical protein
LRILRAVEVVEFSISGAMGDELTPGIDVGKEQH